MAEIGQQRRYEPDPEYSYSPEEFARRVRGTLPPSRTPARNTSTPSKTPSFGRSASGFGKKSAGSDPMLGQKVRHPEYGVGTVVAVEGDEDDRKLAVTFPGRGTKKFIERYAQLTQA